MKGNEKLIEQLNVRLAEELTAINQYMVHAEMCENWGYKKLGEMIEKRAMVEMKHAEKLIERILFLDGRPIVSNLNKINIGDEVPKMHKNDLGLEVDAVGG
jgi:bacterioferritin